MALRLDPCRRIDLTMSFSLNKGSLSLQVDWLHLRDLETQDVEAFVVQVLMPSHSTLPRCHDHFPRMCIQMQPPPLPSTDTSTSRSEGASTPLPRKPLCPLPRSLSIGSCDGCARAIRHALCCCWARCSPRRCALTLRSPASLSRRSLARPCAPPCSVRPIWRCGAGSSHRQVLAELASYLATDILILTLRPTLYLNLAINLSCFPEMPSLSSLPPVTLLGACHVFLPHLTFSSWVSLWCRPRLLLTDHRGSLEGLVRAVSRLADTHR